MFFALDVEERCIVVTARGILGPVVMYAMNGRRKTGGEIRCFDLGYPAVEVAVARRALLTVPAAV